MSTRLHSLVADGRSAVRLWKKRPLSVAAIVLVLALGIGLNALLFIVIHSLVNGPLPGLERDDSLVRIRGIARAFSRNIGREFSYPEYREYAAEDALFSAVAAWSSADVVIDAAGAADRRPSGAATFVTPNYFQVLGVQPALGPGLPVTGDDADAPAHVAVISHVVWDRLFGRSPSAIGQWIDVNGVRVTVVGVAPRRFNGARTGGSTMRVWLPLVMRPVILSTPSVLADEDAAVFGLVARLQPGVEIPRTLSMVRTIAERPRGRTTNAASADVAPLLATNYFPPSGEESSGVGPFVGLIPPLLVLVITGTNASALMAGLALARRREIAVRLALGASRRRVVRQLLTESLLLALAASVVGLVALRIAATLIEGAFPDLELVFDWRGLAFATGIALATGILAGLSPALHATRRALSGALSDTASAVVAGRSYLQAGLVIAQIAFTQPALLGMGTLLLEMRSELTRLQPTTLADRIVELRFNVNPRYGRLDQAREDTLERLRRRIAEMPGVAGVVAQDQGDSFDVEVLAGDGAGDSTSLQVDGQPAPPGYFAVMGLSVVRGRDFDPTMDLGTNAAIVGTSLSRRLWGDEEAVGRRIDVAPTPGAPTGTLLVIGVVDDAASLGRRRPLVYLPNLGTTSHLLIRTDGPARTLLPDIRALAVAEAPEVPVTASRTLADIEAEARRPMARGVVAAGGIAGLALFISAIGLYAVVTFAVGQRVREIGIRTALGADRQRIVRLFLSRGLRLGLVGLSIGLVLSLLVVRLITLSQGNNWPAGLAGVAAMVASVMMGVAVAAAWIPARRAARVDPLQALRME